MTPSQILSFIDLTSLDINDTPVKIAGLCDLAISDLGVVAAVCVFPSFVKQAKHLLLHQSVKVATVLNFPHGQESLDRTLIVMNQAIRDGADELDVVFPYRQYQAGHKKEAIDYIQALKKKSSSSIKIKVILETGALKQASLIEEVSLALCETGIDFLKTSTGKVAEGATLEAVEAMLAGIQSYHEQTGRLVGIKISGGIRSVEDATNYLSLIQKRMGDSYLSADYVRIGASRLVEALLKLV